MAEKTDPTPRGSRHWWWVGAGVVVVIVIGLVVFFATRSSDGDASATPTDPPAPPPLTTSAPTTSPPGATSGPSDDPSGSTPTGAPSPTPRPKPVDIDKPAEFGDGVSAAFVTSKSITGKGTGPGEISGPAVAVTLELTNDTKKSLSLEGVTINLYFGKDVTPASPLFTDPRDKPFDGSVKPGASRQATYVFTLAKNQRDTVRIEITHSALSPMIAFEGSLS